MDKRETSIHIHTLGGLAIRVNGESVELPASRKTRALLAFLAMATRPQRRDRLCEIFWEIPDDPRGSLRWSLSKIRKVFAASEHQVLIADGERVSLNKSLFTVDVDEIDRYVGSDPKQSTTQALVSSEKLLAGPFLPGLELDRCPEFHPWLMGHRNRLDTLRVKIIRTLAERHDDQPEQALKYLSSLHSLFPDDVNLKDRIKKLNADINRTAASLHNSIDPLIVESSPAKVKEDKPSIIVLPFLNIADDADQEYFADGVTEDIITALSRIRWLFVIARNTAFTYKGQTVNVSEMAREIGVRYVLEGSIQKADKRVRVTAQLIDGETGNHIWADRFDRQLEHVFEVQDEITENIAGALEPQLVTAEHLRIRDKPARNLDAWDHTIRAISLSREFTRQGSRDALDLLEAALAIDPTYARALSQLAWILCWRIHQGWEEPQHALPLAEKAAEKAVYFDPDEPWAHIAWLFIATIRKDGNLLLSAAHRAVEANSNFAMAHSWLGASYALTGQGDRALEWIEKARRLSPRDMFREEFDVHTCFAYFQMGNYNKAVEYASKASIPRPNHVYPLLIRCASHAQLAIQDRAEADLLRIMELSPELTLSQARDSCVFIMQPDINRFIEGLEKAGMRE